MTSSRASRYRLINSSILCSLRETPAWVRLECARVIAGLVHDPYEVEGIKPFPPLANAFTVRFEDALLVYQVMGDHPVVSLKVVVLLTGREFLARENAITYQLERTGTSARGARFLPARALPR